MSRIFAIDPGQRESGWVVYSDGRVVNCGVCPNESLRGKLMDMNAFCTAPVVCEMIGHYGTGMPAGKSVFDTCVWIGRFQELAVDTFDIVYRPDVKLFLCGSRRAKDANIRQALIDRFGGSKEIAIGRKAEPGPLYHVKNHAWAALAVAVYYWETVVKPKPVAR